LKLVEHRLKLFLPVVFAGVDCGYRWSQEKAYRRSSLASILLSACRRLTCNEAKKRCRCRQSMQWIRWKRRKAMPSSFSPLNALPVVDAAAAAPLPPPRTTERQQAHHSWMVPRSPSCQRVSTAHPPPPPARAGRPVPPPGPRLSARTYSPPPDRPP